MSFSPMDRIFNKLKEGKSFAFAAFSCRFMFSCISVIIIHILSYFYCYYNSISNGQCQQVKVKTSLPNSSRKGGGKAKAKALALRILTERLDK